MKNFLVPLYSLLLLNSFFKILPFLTSENQPFIILLAFLFSFTYFLSSNLRSSLFFISKNSQYLILIPPIMAIFLFGVINTTASFYSLLVYFQIPLYLFSTIYLFSKSINRKLFINWFFKWLYILLPISLILNLQGIYISGISGNRGSLGRGGGLPLYTSAPSALVGLSLSRTTLYILMSELNLNDLYGVKKSRILILISFIFIASRSAAVVIYSIGLFILYFIYIILLNAYKRGFIVYSIKVNKKRIKLISIFIFIFVVSNIIFPEISNYFMRFRPIYVISDFFNSGLPALFVQASYRPSFTFASFLPDSLINFFFGHGLDHWYGNYLEKTFEAASILGQNTTAFPRLLNERRLMSIRPPSVLGFVFYSYGLLGLYTLFNTIGAFWNIKNISFLSKFKRKSLKILFFFLFTYTILCPGLAFNPLLFSIFPFSVITLYYSYEMKFD